MATNNAFAAGHRAKALHTGSFVWADSTESDFTTSGTNQFLIRASGGVGIGKTNPATALDVLGTVTATAFAGNGSSLLGVNATNLAGTVSLTQLPSVIVTNNATGLTAAGKPFLTVSADSFTRHKTLRVPIDVTFTGHNLGRVINALHDASVVQGQFG